MTDNAKYTFGGVSKRLGKYKVRVGQGAWEARAKPMIKDGHEDLTLINFDKPMTKAQICEKLLTMPEFSAWVDVIKETFDKKTAQIVPAASKAKPVPKATKAAKAVKEPKVAPVVEEPKRAANSIAKIIPENDGYEEFESNDLSDFDIELASFFKKYGN